MGNNLTPIKAIRKNCIDCSGGSPSEVKNCVIDDCSLYEFRLGKNPRRRGISREKKVILEILS